MAYCQAMPLPVLQFTPRSLNPELFGWAILSKPLWAEPRMRETRAAARAQLIRASNLEDLSDANYRQREARSPASTPPEKRSVVVEHRLERS